MRVAVVQMVPRLADVDANLEAAVRLGDEAGAAGARWIVLPEFFTTGIGFDERLAGAAVAPDGPALDVLRDLATRHGATVGGSFLCRDGDGHVRNAFLLVGPDGTVAGRHDKDLPTMWENAFYRSGADEGLLAAEGLDVGVALCWELIRSATARRLRGRCDIVVGGSAWWSVPAWPPRAATRRWEAANRRAAHLAPTTFARLVGAPVVHAAHAGALEGRMPGLPLAYHGRFEGGTLICDGGGRTVAARGAREGEGVVLADVELGRREPPEEVPDRYWLQRRGPVPTLAWHHQRWHGRRWYGRHVAAGS
jgi:predicted amidohydrolase